MYRILKEENNVISAEKYEEKIVNRAEVEQKQKAIEQFEAQLIAEKEALTQKEEKLEAMKAELAEKLEIVRLADEAKQAEQSVEKEIQESVEEIA